MKVQDPAALTAVIKSTTNFRLVDGSTHAVRYAQQAATDAHLSLPKPFQSPVKVTKIAGRSRDLSYRKFSRWNQS
jgi:hypothetical protein